jgi:hypothetical protein
MKYGRITLLAIQLPLHPAVKKPFIHKPVVVYRYQKEKGKANSFVFHTMRKMISVV